MGYSEVKIHVSGNEVTVSWEEDSVLHVFYVELGRRAGYHICGSPRETLTIYSGSRDNDALISVVRSKDFIPFLVRQRRISSVVARNIILKYYREILRNLGDSDSLKRIVRKFLGMAN